MRMTDTRATPVTEEANPATSQMDTLSALEIVTLINQEDARVAVAVQTVLPQIAQAVDVAADRLGRGGRMLYFGSGTSGRLGVLDASEMPPTYHTPPEMVQGIIAGGDSALRRSAEGAEDDSEAGRAAVRAAQIGPNDVVVGLSVSGGAPWVLGVIQAALEQDAATVGITCNPTSALAQAADIAIAPDVGPEVVAGSSRMKGGTAQKMILNMLSTAVMVRLHKVYGNLMVDVSPSNTKLRKRAARILQQAAGVGEAQAVAALEESGYRVKPALVMLLAAVSLAEAEARLERVAGDVRQAIQ